MIATTADPTLRGLSDPDLFEVAQEQERAVVTYNRADFEAIVRDWAEVNREHHGLVIVHPTRFPSWESARLVEALDAFLNGSSPTKSFVVWLRGARVIFRLQSALCLSIGNNGDMAHGLGTSVLVWPWADGGASRPPFKGVDTALSGRAVVRKTGNHV